MKICSKCNSNKNETDFSESQFQNQYSICKSCISAYNAEYRSRNKNLINKAQKERYNKNKEYYAKRNKEYRLKNKDKVKEINKLYQEKTQYNKQYRLDNKDLLREKKRIYIRNRYKNNLVFKLRILMSGAINKSLKYRNVSKNGKSISNFLEYSFEDLINHIEKQFEPWMNWDNHGIYNIKTWNDNDQSTWTWQIDHIIPHKEFKYVSMEDDEFKKCWSLNNLRPYSSKQNWLDGINNIRIQTYKGAKAS